MRFDVFVADNRFVDKYTLGCGGLIAFFGLLVVGVILWAFWDARPDSIEIRNESSQEIVVGAEAGFCGSLTVEIAPGNSAMFQDGWLRCNQPKLAFYRGGLAAHGCKWKVAYANQPVVVTDESVSCDRDGVSTTGDDDPSPTPGGVDENGSGRGLRPLQ